MKRKSDAAAPGALKRKLRIMELSSRAGEPVKPVARRTHPRTGRVAIVGSFARGVPPFMRDVHSALAERLLSDGFRVQLSSGEDLRELDRAEGILITDPVWLTAEREESLIEKHRGFVHLSLSRPGPNSVFLDSVGAWMDFLLAAERRKTTRILLLETYGSAGMPSLTPPEPLLKAFPHQKKLPLFQPVRKEELLRSDLLTDDACLLTDDAGTAMLYSGENNSPSRKNGRRTHTGFWSACMLPGRCAPLLRNRSFQADPDSTAREMQRVLYRQMTTGNTSDPGAILPILWTGEEDPEEGNHFF